MPQDEKKLFRQKSLERLSSPEKLDQLMQITGPKGWWWINTLGVFIVVIFGWSIFGRIPMTVFGEGILVFPGRINEIEAKYPGRLNKILVKFGEKVEKDEVIAYLEQPDLELKVREQEQKLQLLELQFYKEKQILQEQVKIQTSQIKQQKASYQEQLKQAQIFGDLLKNKNFIAIDTQEKNLKAQLTKLNRLTPLITAKNFDSLAVQRRSYEENLKEVQELDTVLEKSFETQKDLRKRELITQDAFIKGQQEYLQNKQQIANLQSQIEELKVKAIEIEQKDLDNQQKIDDLINQIDKLEVEKAKIEQDFFDNQDKIIDLQAKILESDTQQKKIELDLTQNLDKQKIELQDARSQLAQFKQQLKEQSEIKAEYAGVILGVNFNTGAIVQSGENIATIDTESDTNSVTELVGVSYFSIGDGKKINPGMEIQMTPSSVKREDFGGIIGKVVSVSPFPVTTLEASRIIGDQDIVRIWL